MQARRAWTASPGAWFAAVPPAADPDYDTFEIFSLQEFYLNFNGLE